MFEFRSRYFSMNCYDFTPLSHTHIYFINLHVLNPVCLYWNVSLFLQEVDFSPYVEPVLSGESNERIDMSSLHAGVWFSIEPLSLLHFGNVRWFVPHLVYIFSLF